MKKILLSSLAAAAVAVGSANAQFIATDNAGNYGGVWTDGSNLGSGFQPWVLSSSGGTGGFGGNFIGNPNDGGISAMGTTAFSQFANATGSGAFANADRALSSALQVGDTFSFVWGLNWDSGAGGNKGFNLYSGGTGGIQEININMGGSATLTINGNDMLTAFGTQPLSLSFTLLAPTSLQVAIPTGRDGGAGYTNTFAIAAAPDAFRFYSSDMQGGNDAQMYFNNLNVVPEPSTYALLTLGALALGGYAARRRARK